MSEVSEPGQARPGRRFSQAISEGDGISVIPVVRGDVDALARAAEAAGAEAIAVETLDDLRLARSSTELPILLRGIEAASDALTRAFEAGADAVALPFADLDDDESHGLQEVAASLGLDCPLAVGDEDELDEALERLDPEILLLARRRRASDDGVEHALDLLAGVPVGKLVVSESDVRTRDDVLELELAGVDAVIVDPGEELALDELVAVLVGGVPGQ